MHYDPLTGEGELERKWLHDQPHYKLSFKDRIAPVDRLDHDMLREYLELLHIETTPKDYVIYAVHNIELMLDYAVIKIMGDRTRFLSAVQLFQYTDLPSDVQDSQLKIIESLGQSMNSERAYEFMQADQVERVIFAFKHYHPKFRPVVCEFLKQVFEHGSKYLDL